VDARREAAIRKASLAASCEVFSADFRGTGSQTTMQGVRARLRRMQTEGKNQHERALADLYVAEVNCFEA
jgi:hypothetical protein